MLNIYSRILITCGNVKKQLGCVAARSFSYKQISNISQTCNLLLCFDDK